MIKNGNHILSGKYSFLGVKNIDFENINWHKDYLSLFQWKPGTYYKNYTQVDLSNNSDVKIPRELSRSHHILQVAVAYKLTKDQRFSNFVLKQIDNWIDNNPLMYSINWGCSMDISIRAINWMWALSLISVSYNKNDEKLLKKINTSLYEHGWFIYRNLEGNIFNYNNNHYLSNLSGLIFIGEVFQDDHEAKKWTKYAKYSFFREIRLQILPSGMSFERSFHYNRLVLEIINWSFIFLNHNNHKVPQDISTILENMYNFLYITIKPDSSVPNIGDQDNGRLLPFGNEKVDDFKYLFSISSVLFNNYQMKENGNGYNIYCSQLGKKYNLKNYNNIYPYRKSTLRSKYINDAGFLIIRDGLNYMITNIKSRGNYLDSKIQTVHTHSDLLSFELFINDKTFIVDPGTYAYSSDSKLRNLYRSTIMHNTAIIDNNNQEHVNDKKIFEMSNNSNPNLELFKETNNSIFFSAYHDGYKRLKNSVIHKRTVNYNKKNKSWSISDSFLGNGTNLIETAFHFSEKVQLLSHKKNSFITKSIGSNIKISFTSKSKFKVLKRNYLLSKVLEFFTNQKKL